ncbi:MAG: hypothetical protein Q3960_01765 [Lactobacillus sp.]|nr:hypothetical protein [Lactobacillus sp.]
MLKIKRRYSFLFYLFCLMALCGIMVSKIETHQANELIKAYGLSPDTRYFQTDDNETTIRQFIKKVNRYKNVQLYFSNIYNKHAKLIWANKEIRQMPTYSGRYFSLDEFSGRVTVAAVEYGAKLNTRQLQGNKYLIANNTYYPVIGEIKPKSNNYYLTTGLKQATSLDLLSNYTVYVDGPKKLLKNLSKQYKLQVPNFVKNYQPRWDYIMIMTAILAFLTFLNWDLSYTIAKEFKKYWEAIVGVLVVYIITNMLLSHFVFYSNLLFLLGLMSAEFVISAIAIYQSRRKHATTK